MWKNPDNWICDFLQSCQPMGQCLDGKRNVVNAEQSQDMEPDRC
ncbi:MAG: hypothetical protein V8T87_13780 [Victivallales bacterium]